MSLILADREKDATNLSASTEGGMGKALWRSIVALDSSGKGGGLGAEERS